MYLTADENGNIYATVTNDYSTIPGMSEDLNGIITITPPRTVTDLGDGVLLIE